MRNWAIFPPMHDAVFCKTVNFFISPGSLLSINNCSPFPLVYSWLSVTTHPVLLITIHNSPFLYLPQSVPGIHCVMIHLVRHAHGLLEIFISCLLSNRWWQNIIKLGLIFDMLRSRMHIDSKLISKEISVLNFNSNHEHLDRIFKICDLIHSLPPHTP